MTDFVRVDSLGGTLRIGALESDNRGGQTLTPIMMPILLAKIGTIIGARSLGLTSTNGVRSFLPSNHSATDVLMQAIW